MSTCKQLLPVAFAGQCTRFDLGGGGVVVRAGHSLAVSDNWTRADAHRLPSYLWMQLMPNPGPVSPRSRQTVPLLTLPTVKSHQHGRMILWLIMLGRRRRRWTSTAVQSHKAVTAYFSSEQLLPFGFADHNILKQHRSSPQSRNSWAITGPGKQSKYFIWNRAVNKCFASSYINNKS